MKGKNYVVTAYRWGSRENHSYVIGCFSKKHKAITVADTHTKRTGGKYPCVVDECIIDEYNERERDYTKEVYKTKSCDE